MSSALDCLFRPRAIAVIGATAKPLSIGHLVLKNLQEHGFPGALYPINPRGGEIRGLPAFPSVREVPAAIDLANIAVSPAQVPEVLEQCGQHGVKFCIVHTAGYKESGAAGLARERELVAIAQRYGMRIFGPNSQGVQNADPAHNVYANFTFVPMVPGNISIIAQSGGIGELLKLHLYRAGLGHRLYASYGNESDLSMPELLAYYGEDEGTALILLQVESFRDPRAFLAAARVITPHKPLLALKCGQSRAGALAVCSHTGMLVDQAALARALFASAGALEFRDTATMIQAARAFSSQPLPRGRRLGIITNTGGPGIQAVDEAIEQGLELAAWSPTSKALLAEQLLPAASLGNPLDVVATAGPAHFAAAISALLVDPQVEMLLIFWVTASFVDGGAVARAIREAAGQASKPVVVVVETLEDRGPLVEELRAARLPVYQFAEEGVRALAALTRYAELRARPLAEPPALAVAQHAIAPLLARARARAQGEERYLPQPEAFALLAAYGLAVPRLVAVSGPQELAAAAAQTGFPCVLKVDAPRLLHKSDEGGVILNLHDETTLRAAFAELRERFVGQPVSYLLMEQLPVGCEVMVSASAVENLGSLVLFALGGHFVEALRDSAAAVGPLSHPAAQALLRGIHGYPVLAGWRGRPAVDLAALEELLLRVSRLAADWPALAELELNPVLLYPAGRRPTVVDVRMRLR